MELYELYHGTVFENCEVNWVILDGEWTPKKSVVYRRSDGRSLSWQ
jgi:hypothetical protein